MIDQTCYTCHGTGEGSFGGVCRDCSGMGVVINDADKRRRYKETYSMAGNPGDVAP